MSKFKMWALAEGFVPQKLDLSSWSFADATAYFEKYEYSNTDDCNGFAGEIAKEALKKIRGKR